MTVIPIMEPDTGTIRKDPNSERIYQFNYTDFLAGLSVGSPEITIDASTMFISGPDTSLTFDNDSIVTGGLKTQLRLVGGTEGVEYLLTNRIVTTGTPAQTDDRSIPVLVESR